MEQESSHRPVLLHGRVGEEVNPMLCLRLGMSFAGVERAALGCGGGDAALMLTRALGVGLNAVGCMVLAHDGASPAVGAWMREYYELPLSLFVEQQGTAVTIHRFGIPPGAPGAAVGAGQVGSWERLQGVNTRYAAAEKKEVYFSGKA